MEKLNDFTDMILDDGDIYVSQQYADDKVRSLRLTKFNIRVLQGIWQNLLIATIQAQKDKVVDEEYGLGDRIKVTVSTDFPNIHLRRWKKPGFNGDVYPTDHGFILKQEDYPLFEQNMNYFLQLM